MISAKQCRIYAAECMARASSSIIANRRSLEQSIMALNWSALADEIDRENGEPDWRRSFRWVPHYILQTSKALHALVIRPVKPPLDRGEAC
jgi:hypothetical protein